MVEVAVVVANHQQKRHVIKTGDIDHALYVTSKAVAAGTLRPFFIGDINNSSLSVVDTRRAKNIIRRYEERIGKEEPLAEGIRH